MAGTEDTPTRATLLSDGAALAAYLRRRLAQPMTLADDVIAVGDDDAPLPEAQRAQRTIGARAASVLAPLYTLDGRPYLLFTRRSPDLTAHRGEISFPGGSRDADDASPAATALRETTEELGLHAASIELLGALPSVFTGVSNFLVTPFVGWLGEGPPDLQPNPAEVALVIEAPLAELADPAIYHTEVWRRAGLAHTVHFYDLGPQRIWGLTGRMLHTLLSVLPAS